MVDEPAWVTLTEGEELVWEDKPSLVPYLTSLVGELILVVLALGIWLTGGVAFLIGRSFDPTLAFLPLPFWTLVGLILFAWGRSASSPRASGGGAITTSSRPRRSTRNPALSRGR